MKYLFTIALTTLIVLPTMAQNHSETSAIVAEGKALYRLEMASWHGTDIFLEKFKSKRNNIGGYFSYPNNDRTNCLFFSGGDNPKVLGVISFDDAFNVSTAVIDGNERDFTETEKNIYQIRKKALDEINSDTLFKTYKNTNLNLVPLENGDERKVFVLTGPQVNGVVIFGNDYLLTFDKDNNLTGKKQLHKNIIPINHQHGDMEVIGTMHSHLPETGDYITSTDICTLMLYARLAKWKQHYVISGKYVSIWDCTKNELIILTREAWDRIGKDKGQRNKD